MSQTHNLSNDSRVLCCFADQNAARPYESALVNCGVSLLRARDGMHAHWLANASKPRLAIVDARGSNDESNLLLARIQGNEKLSGLRVLVITDAELSTSLTKQFVAISSRITPAELASRVSGMVEGMEEEADTQSVDDFFSEWGDVQKDLQISKSAYIRTDGAGGDFAARPRQESVRPSRTRAGQ